MKKHLYLIGYRGCGKTSVARCLAARLACPWVDTDVLVEAQAQRTIREIFATDGENAFRDFESCVLHEVSKQQPQVISLGGGAILRPENRQCLAETGQSVWLQATPEVLAQRISSDSQTGERRPSLTGQSVLEEIREVLQRRTPLYHATANFAIDTNQLNPDAIAEQIVVWLRADGTNIIRNSQ